MSYASLSINEDARGVITLCIQRADVHNAFDDVLIKQLIDELEHIENSSTARVLILKSDGESFSAGADLNWMRRTADYSAEQNNADAMELATLMKKLNTLSIPTIARVQGAAFGGGVGLVACCDIAVGSDKAVFCLSEVRLGLLPAVISPYVIAAIGERSCRRYFLTAERFNATEAQRLNLLHTVVDAIELDDTIEAYTKNLLKGGTNAQAAAKNLISTVSAANDIDNVVANTVEYITAARASIEGKEGLNAFLEKRPPNWLTGQ